MDNGEFIDVLVVLDQPLIATEADGEILEIGRRCHHHGFGTAAIHKRYRSFFSQNPCLEGEAVGVPRKAGVRTGRAGNADGACTA